MINKIYRILLEVYFHIRPMRIKELFVGTKAWEDYWIKRKRGNDWNMKSHDWVKGYWDSIEHPHRQLVADAVSRFEPNSILEVGCASAPNLRLLVKKYPKADIWGVDINSQAIEYAHKMFQGEGAKNVTLLVNKLDTLMFIDNSFDVVLSDATLIYIGKDKILDVMGRLIKMARKGLVLAERHIEGSGALGVYKDALWQRDYVELVRKFAPLAEFYITPISKDVWKEWSGTGCVIEVRL